MTGLESRSSESSREDAAPNRKTRTDETFSTVGNSFIFGGENVPSGPGLVPNSRHKWLKGFSRREAATTNFTRCSLTSIVSTASRRTLPRSLCSRRRVKDVSGHSVRDVMGLNKPREDGALGHPPVWFAQPYTYRGIEFTRAVSRSKSIRLPAAAVLMIISLTL